MRRIQVVPLLITFQFELQAEVLQVEFVGPLLLLVAFQTQRTQNDFQRFAVLGKILELRVHSVRLL